MHCIIKILQNILQRGKNIYENLNIYEKILLYRQEKNTFCMLKKCTHKLKFHHIFSFIVKLDNIYKYVNMVLWYFQMYETIIYIK